MQSPALVSIAVVLALFPRPGSAQELSVYHMAVGQGDAALIVSPSGVTCLVDAGPPGAGTAVVVPLLNQLGITTLHYTVVSHYHDDHFGGMAEVVAAGFLPTIAAYDRGSSNEPNGDAAFDQYVAAVSSRRAAVSPGQVIDLGSGVTLTCVGVNGIAMSGAFVVLSGSAAQKENARSVSLRLQYGDYEEAFCGDLTGGPQGSSAAEALLAPLLGDVDVLKVHHHGAIDATTAGFVGPLAPEVSIISVSASPFGFPAQGVLDILLAQPTAQAVYRLQQGSSAVGGTVVNGTLHIQTDGSSYTCSGGLITPLTRDVDEAHPPPPAMHAPGDVVVSEYMADPAIASDTTGEWIELRNMTAAPIALKGFTVRDFGTDYVVLPSGTIPPLGYFVIGRSSNFSNNGGYVPNFVWPTNAFVLGNTSDQIEVISPQGVVLDVVSYAPSSFPHATGESAERIDAIGPPSGSNFTAATTAYGAGDLGTPGVLNAADLTPPLITAQPAGATACEGATFALAVSAAGTGPLTYQWRRNGIAIGGATLAGYDVLSATPGDTGSYDVVVTNTNGSSTSTAAVVVVTPLPSIDTPPSSQEACVGDPASFTVVASGADLSYQWRKNGVPIDGATSATCPVPEAEPSDAGTYDVVVTGTCGSTTSAPATLVVRVAPGIEDQPTGGTVCVGAPFTFSSSATGASPAYQWRKGGTEIPGATSATYAIPSASELDAGSYDVVVTDACGSITSVSATLTVIDPAGIVAGPSDATVCPGGPASFSVTASGTPPVDFQWRRNGVEIPGAVSPTYVIDSASDLHAGSYDVVVANGCGAVATGPAILTVLEPVTITSDPAGSPMCAGAPFSLSVSAQGSGPLTYQWRKAGAEIPGATSATYVIPSASELDAGSYDVVVSNACGSITSASATLTLIEPAGIVAGPSDATVCSGAAASFSVTASGTPPVDFQWRRNGVEIPGAVSPTYVIDSATNTTAGSYDVVVANGCGAVTTGPAILTVLEPVTITSDPAGSPMCAGAPFSLSVSAQGSAPLTYQWRKAGAEIPGATSAAYVINTASELDAGSYDVVVSNACGSITSASATFALIDPAGIVAGPSDATVCSGAAASFSVTASGTPPVDFQWRRNGVEIPGAVAPTYVISSASELDAGSYDVVVANGCDAVTTGPAILTVLEPVTITSDPAGSSMCAGDPFSLSVSAAGSGPLTYQWRKDGADLPGVVGTTYAVAAAGAGDEGVYDVVVTGACGPATSAAAVVSLHPALSITAQPAAQAACLNGDIVLSVAATGPAPVTYQWRKDGADLPGETGDTLLITGATAAHAGSYDVVVTGACGSVTSDAAAVTVGSPVILALTPPAIAPMAPGGAPVTILVTGSCFTEASVVRANGAPLATTMVDASTLSCELGPQVPQTLAPGGICMNVVEPGVPVSNSFVLVVGSGNNAGTMRRDPFDVAPGQLYSILMEGGVPFSPFTLIADFGHVLPYPAFPDPVTNFVLAVSPLAGSAGPFVIVFDGMGIFGPPSGIAFDGSGSFVIPFIPLPNPPLGVAVTLQAVYFDFTSPLGFRLTWARFPEQI